MAKPTKLKTDAILITNPAGGPKETLFKPGQSGNPGGKPVGSRNRITTAFLNALAEDFDVYGKDAIKLTRETDPATYVKVCASLLPKQVEQTHPLDDVPDAELLAIIDVLRSRLAEAAGAGAGEAAEPSTSH
jgi:hypothetical protein